MIENPNENLKCSSFLFDFVWVSIDKVWFDEDYLKKKKILGVYPGFARQGAHVDFSPDGSTYIKIQFPAATLHPVEGATIPVVFTCQPQFFSARLPHAPTVSWKLGDPRWSLSHI